MIGKIKWVIAEPLTGGMGMGFEKILGSPPLCVIHAEGYNNDFQYINYLNNVKGLNIPVINTDGEFKKFITEEDEILFNKIINENQIDIVPYVCICSGLSMLNNCTTGCNARGDANNNQNQNMYNLSSFILEKIKPKVACFENAPNAYSNSGKGVLDKLVEIGNRNEYSFSVEKVDTYDHGVPQHRQRTFVYFWNSKTSPYLKYEKKETLDLVKYLQLIPKDASQQDSYCISKDSIKDTTYECIQDLYNKNKHKSI